MYSDVYYINSYILIYVCVLYTYIYIYIEGYKYKSRYDIYTKKCLS